MPNIWFSSHFLHLRVFTPGKTLYAFQMQLVPSSKTPTAGTKEVVESREARGGRALRKITRSQHLGGSWESTRPQAVLCKEDLLSYPKSWSSSASPSDLLHRSEGSWALIFPSRDSALPIRAPHGHCAPARCYGKRQRERWVLPLLTVCSSERSLLCLWVSSQRGSETCYSSHWHSPAWPRGTGRSPHPGSMQT